MKKFWKILIICSCFLLSLNFTACSKDTESNKSQNSPSEETSQRENSGANKALSSNENSQKSAELSENQTANEEGQEIDYKDLKSWEKESEDYNESEDGKVLEAYEVNFKVPNIDTYHIIKNYQAEINGNSFTGDLTLKETKERRLENSDKREFLVTYVGELNKAE